MHVCAPSTTTDELHVCAAESNIRCSRINLVEYSQKLFEFLNVQVMPYVRVLSPHLLGARLSTFWDVCLNVPWALFAVILSVRVLTRGQAGDEG